MTNIEIAFLGTTLYLPGQYETFSAHEISKRIFGSKIEFGSEHVRYQQPITVQMDIADHLPVSFVHSVLFEGMHAARLPPTHVGESIPKLTENWSADIH